MKHFNEILATLGATDIFNSFETQDWSFWSAMYRTPAGSVPASYLYLKYKCPQKEATAHNLLQWMSLSRNQGYVAIVTPRSTLATNLANTKSIFAAKSILTSKQLLLDNFLRDMNSKPVQDQDSFIDPDLQLEDGTTAHQTTRFLTQWFRGEAKTTKNASLAVLVADGGVGKTTVARMLCHSLQKYDPSTIPILVESDQWRNILQSTPTMDAVWDLAISRRFEHAGRLLANATALRVLIREGLFVVIFDGFDELCVAPGSHFKPRDIFNDLIQMVTPEDDVQQARIIVTSRKTYWDSIADDIDLTQLDVFRLKGFDNDQRKRYFEVRLKRKEEQDLAYRLSKEIGGSIYDSIPKDDANENRPSGVPFILDLIAQYVHDNSEASVNPYQADPLASLLENVCKRENRRQTLGIEPSTQFEIFEELFREYPDTFSTDDIKLYMDCVANVTDTSVLQRFTNHVFLTRLSPDIFAPRYEVLRVYFIARFLALGLSSLAGKTNRSAIAKLLAAHKTGKTQVIDWLVEQLLRFDKQKRIVAVHHAVDIINDPDNREIQRASSMALFHLATKLLSGQDKSERCQELSMFLKAESGVGLTRFCNLASAGTVKSFDFQTTEFVKCSFESVDFRNCLFSGKTMFLSCSFDGTLGFHGCDGASSIVLKDCTFSKEAEFVISALTNMGIREETKRQFAEDALARALRKFKGPFGFDGIQYRYRMSGFKSGNPYNEKILDTLSHLGIIEKHKISNVAEGGLNIVHNKDVRREIIFFFDNGVLGKLLQAVIAEVIR